jgi:hypothetical protein
MSLAARMYKLGRAIGEREDAHRQEMDAARQLSAELHAVVESALHAFHEAASSAGAPHLRSELSPPRVDDKHLRAVEFALQRGRHRAIVTVKSKGQVTLVGPFHAGKNEGPCASFGFEARADLDAALGDFLERFLEEAASP